jgi:hypothetical protein
MQEGQSKHQRRAGDAISSNSTTHVLSGGVLRHVLDLVGPGEWRFVAEVSSLFKAAYEKVPATQPSVYLFCHEDNHTEMLAPGTDPLPSYWLDATGYWVSKFSKAFCEPQHTTHAAIFASSSRWDAVISREGLQLNPKALFAAGVFADIELLQRIHKSQRDKELAVHTAAGVAASNSLEKLQWFSAHYITDANKELFVRQMLRVAARAGSLPIFKWMWFRYPAIITNDDVTYLLCLAVSAGKLDLCQFLPIRDQMSEWDYTPLQHAAAFGHHDLVRWILTTWPEVSASEACMSAAFGGHTLVLDTLLTHPGQDCEVGQLLVDALNYAGAGQKKEVIQWLRARGAAWPDTLRCGTEWWVVDMVQWARTLGCNSIAEADEELID